MSAQSNHSVHMNLELVLCPNTVMFLIYINTIIYEELRAKRDENIHENYLRLDFNVTKTHIFKIVIFWFNEIIR